MKNYTTRIVAFGLSLLVASPSFSWESSHSVCVPLFKTNPELCLAAFFTEEAIVQPETESPLHAMNTLEGVRAKQEVYALARKDENPSFNGHGIITTTYLSFQQELDVLLITLEQLKKEKSNPGSGHLPLIIAISDEHGTIDKFDEFILHSLRSVLPANAIPLDRLPRLDPDRSLQDQLASFGIQLIDTFRGKIYFENLGDFMDRGPFGIKIFHRSKELIDAGLSDFVIGNHDFWEFMNLQKFHLPWYPSYNFYGYTDNQGDVQKNWEQYRRSLPFANDPSWWAERLGEFMAYKEGRQKTIWSSLETEINGDLDAKKRRIPGTGLYAQVSASLSPKNKKLWDRFRGNAHETEVYTGVRAVELMSVKWWEELLNDFEDAYETLSQGPTFQANLPAAKAWRRAIDMMKYEIIPPLQRDYTEHIADHDWWWQVFEAINYKNYTSPEWWAKEWLFHEGWGTSVLKELNLASQTNPVTPSNYLSNPTLLEISDFFRDHFDLYQRDIYQNVYMHAFLPIDEETGEFYFRYKGPSQKTVQEFRGKGGNGHRSVWDGLSLIAADVKNRHNSLGDLYEALNLVNSWYADNTTQAKVSNVAWAINKFGAQRLGEANGYHRLYVGHLPFHEFHSKLSPMDRGAISGFQIDDHLIFTDHGMGTKFGGRGGYVASGVEGVHLHGYSSKEAIDGIQRDPATIETVGDDQRVLFANHPIPRERFLTRVIRDVINRITYLRNFLLAERPHRMPLFDYHLRQLNMVRLNALVQEIAHDMSAQLNLSEGRISARIVGGARYLGFSEWQGDIDVALYFDDPISDGAHVEQLFFKILKERVWKEYGFQFEIEADPRELAHGILIIPIHDRAPIEITFELHSAPMRELISDQHRLLQRLWDQWAVMPLESIRTVQAIRRWLQYFLATEYYLGNLQSWDNLRKELVSIPLLDFEGFKAFALRVASRQDVLRDLLREILRIHADEEMVSHAIQKLHEAYNRPIDWLYDKPKTHDSSRKRARAA